jgi:hypothetical protein
MTSQEKATLVLKTSDLTFGQSNSVGSANATGTQCTWNNIDLRVLLGNLYEKYTRFNLSLNTFTTGPCGTLTDAETGTYLSLSGLPFVNNTYAVKTNSLSREAFIGSVLWKPQSTIAATTSSTSTSFIGSITLLVLTVSTLNGPTITTIGGTGGASSTSLVVAAGTATIPIGSTISGNGITAGTIITAIVSATNYTMSSAQIIAGGTYITATLPNPVCLPIGATITGNGITAGTTISAQTGPYTYTINNSQTVGTMPMLSTVTNTVTAASTANFCNDIKYYENSRITFTKNQDVCNLTLSIRRTSNDALPTSTYPNMILVFDIYGCDEYRVDDITRARILK